MKPNILILASHLFIGGAETVIDNLCRGINRKYFNVSVCCLKQLGHVGEDIYKDGFDIFTIPKSGIFKNDYFSFKKLLKVITQKKIDLIHSHTIQTLIDASMCKIFHQKLKVIHTFHFGNYPHTRRKYLVMEKIFSKIPDRLVAVGHEQEKTIKKVFKLQDKRIQTIWNGVKLRSSSQISAIVNKNKRQKKTIIGTVCTLIEQKGLTYLIDVALSLKKRNQTFIFLIAGEGPLRHDLERKCKNFGLENYVTFLGWVKNAAEEFIPSIDIFFMPSLWEAMSVVVLEAMGAAKPVVVTSVGENCRIIENGNNGFLVPPRDVEQMADSLGLLIDDDLLREKLGQNAKKTIEESFSLDKMIKNYEKLYWETLYKPRCDQ